jgi:predicted Rossmann fold nucleotide-binding protein DprA/Smf involved in DNA uptake
MTNREFYTNIANGTITEDVIAHAAAQLVKMDEANEKRKNKPSKKATENAPILESITNALTTEPAVAADIAAAVGISTQKASALLRQLVANGTAAQSEVKVPKKGTVKAYSLAVEG